MSPRPGSTTQRSGSEVSGAGISGATPAGGFPQTIFVAARSVVRCLTRCVGRHQRSVRIPAHGRRSVETQEVTA